MAEPRLVLALDLGSSSARAVVVEVEVAAGLRRVALARRPVTMTYRDDQGGLLDPLDYLRAVESCLDDLQARRALRGVGRVVLSCQWHSLIVLDPRGEPHGPMSTWVSRPGDLVPSASDAPNALREQTGCALHPLYWTMRLPAVRARGLPLGCRFVSLAGFVLQAILGILVESVSLASGTGLLDQDRLDWHPQALELAGVRREELPEIVGASHTVGSSARVARTWPDLAGAQWHVPVGDGAAATIGSGGGVDGALTASIGTSAAVRRHRPRVVGERLGEGLWRYLVDEHTAVTGVAWSGGGNVFAWARRVLRVPEGDDELAALLATSPQGPGPAVAVPYLFGGRPGNPPGLTTGSVVGLSAQTTARDVLVSLLDGIGYEMRSVVDRLATDAAAPLLLGGGAVAASPWWQQRLADQLGRPVEVVVEPEVAAIGAVAHAVGVPPRPDRAVREPRDDTLNAFTERYRAYLSARTSPPSHPSEGDQP